MQTTAEEIAALSPVAPDDQPAIDAAMPSGEPERAPGEQAQTAPIQAPAPRAPLQVAPSEPPPAPEPETAEAAAERERRYREILGSPSARMDSVVGQDLTTTPVVYGHQALAGRCLLQPTTATKGGLVRAVVADREMKTAGWRRLSLSTSLRSVRITRRTRS